MNTMLLLWLQPPGLHLGSPQQEASLRVAWRGMSGEAEGDGRGQVWPERRDGIISAYVVSYPFKKVRVASVSAGYVELAHRMLAACRTQPN